ncbi:MAG TPA: zinc ABC transporter substrate-binding protein [Candidatus Scybalousia intestinigallinarum]|nr:zinc ABC transporter substrate-binding protein [Candidatus Scybalousia intestinigallinarum]
MKKLIKLSILGLFVLVLSSGCFKRDNLEGIEIVTTAYPYEYVTNLLYGEHSLVNSIYPDGTDISTYSLNDKQIKDYSNKELFIYNGLSDDKDIALELLDYNHDMMIIDATSGMETTYGEEELWLNPSNLLMITQNIKTGLNEYITNSYLKKEIDSAYEEIKITLSELDAEIKLTAENATRKTIVVNNDALKFLEKYGFTVISLDDSTNPVSEKTISDVKAMIENQTVRHIILLDKTKNSDSLNQLITDTGITTLTFKRLDNITDTERDNKEDYISLMNDNIDLLKSELY